ncbi:hypothetical protein D9619_010255 [Psilocybe cf. subviscida]|uniref:DUF6533 domain-containing protein n=1 Tax=Psilocybe cf. subviscida TaxID=2480587 RepID=A0A8H5ASS2_9AGAR|nr:hypothetical protein D9619_010255 [Psilocybe cf. subviscida]
MSDMDFYDMRREAINHKYLAFVSLTLVIWECIIALKGEIRFIWRCPSWKTKVTYLFARYFAIGYLSVNLALTFKWTTLFPVPRSMCIRWYAQHISAYSAQYVVSHVTLLRRVFDLNKGRDVAFTFVAFHLAEGASVVFSSKRSVGAMTFDPTCSALSVSKDSFLFLAFFVSGQVMIWSLIIRRVWKPDGRDSPPLDVRAKLYRVWYEGDGKAAWAACFIGIVVNGVYSYARQRVEPTYTFGWPISFLSIATCRYILSLEKEAYIRSRFSRRNSKGKERAIQPPDDIEDGIEITTTTNAVGPSNLMGRHGFARSSRSRSSVLSSDWAQPIGLHSLVTIASTASTEPPSEVMLYTSPTNSIMSYERRRSRTASMGTQETELTEITAPSGSNVSTDIEIGSMHTSSSVNSEELRDFWNETWNRTAHQAGSFIG